MGVQAEAHLRFPTKPAQIEEGTTELISHAKEIYDKIGSVALEDVSLESIFEPHRNLMRDKSIKGGCLDFMQHVSPSKELRDQAVASDKIMSDFDVECSMRKDVFDRFVALQTKLEAAGYECQETKRYIDRMVTYGRRNGLHLDEEKRTKMEALQKEMSKLGIDFSNNISADNTILEFPKEKLTGLKPDFVNSLEDGKEAGTKKLTMKYPHVIPVMKMATDVEVRKAMEKAFNSRCDADNTAILGKLIELRQQKAELLGYPNHSTFITELRMAKTQKAVSTFLQELSQKLIPLRDSDVELMKELRAADGYDKNEPIPMWDLSYYRNKVEESKYQVDQSKIQEYFPMDHVLKEMLSIYQELLDLNFENIPTSSVDADQYWYDKADYYRVVDKASGELMGHFYLDLFPREGKFSHAAQFRLRPGCLDAEGQRVPSCAALVCNFNEATADKPSLLTHREVETLFHEFGHCMHTICATGVKTAMFAGTSVERDFVECPSQMLENWCWEPEILKRMSKHYDTNESLPDDLIDSLVKSRLANEGINNMRQVALASYDQRIHCGEPVDDIAKLFNDMTLDLMTIPGTPGTNMPASWGHLCGYDAQYYGYLWAEVFSADMYDTKFKNRVLSTEQGLEYRNKVLKCGGSIDATEILKDYLGRDPTQEAFLKMKGLNTTAGYAA